MVVSYVAIIAQLSIKPQRVIHFSAFEFEALTQRLVSARSVRAEGIGGGGRGVTHYF